LGDKQRIQEKPGRLIVVACGGNRESSDSITARLRRKKMKKQFLFVALTVACTSAFAATSSEQATSDTNAPSNDNAEVVQLAKINATLVQLLAVQTMQGKAAPDENHFCYQDGKAFSEGAVRDGLTCYRDGIRVSVPGQSPKLDPLRWAKVKQDRPVMQAN
jgi:hypothetical protein